MAKILLSLSVLFLTLSAVFGVLNTGKARSLREAAQKNEAARQQAERTQGTKEKEIQAREAAIAAATAKNAETESKVANAEADLVKSQSEKSELQAKVQESQTQIAELQKRIDEGGGAKELMPDALPMPGAGDLQTQLEETRKQLDSAEREKVLLADRVRTVERGASAREEVKRQTVARRPSLRGTILAVNQAYNFVVLNLGGRQGVEPNSELLVVRDGTPIGRIRVSSVEPATAIGDIITNSLARGVQVQPGDIVIYAGTNS